MLNYIECMTKKDYYKMPMHIPENLIGKFDKERIEELKKNGKEIFVYISNDIDLKYDDYISRMIQKNISCNFASCLLTDDILKSYDKIISLQLSNLKKEKYTAIYEKYHPYANDNRVEPIYYLSSSSFLKQFSYSLDFSITKKISSFVTIIKDDLYGGIANDSKSTNSVFY